MLARSEQCAQLRYKASKRSTFICSHIVLYVADIIDSTWSSLVEGPAVEALHAMVSHNTYCRKLLESDTVDSQTFQEVLSCLLRSAQLTFGACLACLAIQHWDLAASKARESKVKAKESAPRGAESGSRLVYQGTLITICSHIQEAVLVGSLFIHLGSSRPPHSCLCVAQHTLTSLVLLSTNFKCLLLGFVNAHPAALSHSAVSNIPTHLCLQLE